MRGQAPWCAAAFLAFRYEGGEREWGTYRTVRGDLWNFARCRADYYIILKDEMAAIRLDERARLSGLLGFADAVLFFRLSSVGDLSIFYTKRVGSFV